MLNAFRHHRQDHWEITGDPAAPRSCSTPFGITDKITVGEIGPGRHRAEVLNAFRHHRQDHVEGHPRDDAGLQCSTPFGITDKITIGQQLPAAAIPECSTPFGITDKITSQAVPGPEAVERAQRLSASQTRSRPPASPARSDGACVLNAFRHHRQDHSGDAYTLTNPSVCSTPFGITDKITFMDLFTSRPRTSRAQRLSASQTRSRDPRAHPGAVLIRAQRLSASQTRSPKAGVADEGPVKVLNAFRHHRQDHIYPKVNLKQLAFLGAQRLSASQTRSPPRAGLDFHPVVPVLNAFRHHRQDHKQELEEITDDHACSTPFGITDKITIPSSLLPTRVRLVLNAFRHHRQDHTCRATTIGCRRGCSTPFGITDKITCTAMA